MKIKAILLLVFLGLSAQAQTVVRKDGVSTGADVQVSDLKSSKGTGLYIGLEDWRIGVQIPVLVIQEITEDPYDVGAYYLGVAPHVTVERLTNLPAIKWKGALGYSRGDSMGEFTDFGAYLAAGVRIDFNQGDFFFYQQTQSLEFMAETILDVDPKYMLTANIYQSVQLFDAATFDFVFGAGFANVPSWELPALQIRLGVGVGFGGVQ